MLNMNLCTFVIILVILSACSAGELGLRPNTHEHCPRLVQNQVCASGSGTLICPKEAPYIKAVYFKRCNANKYVPFGVDCMGTIGWENPECDTVGDSVHR